VTQDPIIDWLTAFDRLLPLRGRARRRARAELEAHLMDAADEAAGRSVGDPAAEAVRRMGDPAVVAREFGNGRMALAMIAVLLWLPAAVAVTVGVGAAYAIGQQVLRSDANDPQVQIAEDIAAALGNGTSPHAVVGPTVDLARSLATSVTVLDTGGHVLASSATLNGRVPLPPSGALRAADGDATNEVTWQPQSGVRQAAVIVSYHGPSGAGTVLVSRSLRLVEEREDRLLLLSALGWLASLLVAAVLAVISAAFWTSARGPRLGAPVWASA
jgi:hypothetical protein